MATETRAPGGLLGNWRYVMQTCSPPRSGRIDAISRWLVITRACVQPMTLTSAAIAGLLAFKHPGFDGLLFGLAAAGLVVAHAANNMINDYFDVQSGLDTDQYPRALYAPHPVLTGLVTKRGLLRAIAVANFIDLAILLYITLQRGWPILAFALGGLFISVFYVAPPLRLKARGLGEPGVAIVWGPLMVVGTYFAATGAIPVGVWWASVPYALLVTSVLMGKHIDKAPWDQPLGFATLPVRMGEGAARKLTIVLIGGFYAAVGALVGTSVLPVLSLLVLGALPSAVKTIKALSAARPEEPPDNYPIWPLWFASWSFIHARRAGALFVVGLFAAIFQPFHL